MTLYVGNIHFGITSDDLNQIFSEFGEVKSAKVVIDRDSGRSRGFAFVEMADAEGGNKAIEALHGATVNNREIKVNEARPRN